MSGKCRNKRENNNNGGEIKKSPWKEGSEEKQKGSTDTLEE